jgi:hypothetical protein
VPAYQIDDHPGEAVLAIEGAVAQRDALHLVGREHLFFVRAQGRDRRSERAGPRFGERVVLGDQVRAVVPVAVPQHDRLGEEAVGADRPGGREEVGGSRGTQGVRVPHQLPYSHRAQRGQLVHDRIGTDVAHGGEQAPTVHDVGHDGLRTRRAQPLGVGLTAGDADNLVTGRDELPGQRCADGTRGSGEQHSHGCLLPRSHP